MIEVTISYHARKELVGDKTVAALPAFIKFWDWQTFFVHPDETAKLIELCAEKGWEIQLTPIFTTGFDQIKRQCEVAAMPDYEEQL